MRQYDPNQYTLTFAAILFKGFAEDEFFTAKRLTDSFSSAAGVDGEVTRSAMKDKRGQVEVKVGQGSSVNALLSALLTRDENTIGGAGVGPLTIRDRVGGRTEYHADEAWIVGWPEVSLKKAAGERIWKIECANLTMFEGGL